MKVLLHIFRYLVGGLFIFSGLIKVNDPVGTSIKMEEYFEVFAHDIAPAFEWLKPFSLSISVLLIVLEVGLGVMLLLNYRKKLTLSLLLALIIFFTFLTFYSAYFNKVTDCGCFGDAIKLTPWESFIKDIILVVMIGVLFLQQKKLADHQGGFRGVIVVSSLVLSLILSIIAIRNLPFIDFRAYKNGVNIQKGMLPSGVLEYSYIMKKEGEELILDEYPTDESYEFVDMKLKNPEALPKISDFAIWNDEGDFTEQALQGNKLLVCISNFEKMNRDKLDALDALMNIDGIETWVISAASAEQTKALLQEHGWQVPSFYGDATVLKTMIRSNPGLIVLVEGTVIEKYHINNAPSLEEVLDIMK